MLAKFEIVNTDTNLKLSGIGHFSKTALESSIRRFKRKIKDSASSRLASLLVVKWFFYKSHLIRSTENKYKLN